MLFEHSNKLPATTTYMGKKMGQFRAGWSADGGSRRWHPPWLSTQASFHNNLAQERNTRIEQGERVLNDLPSRVIHHLKVFAGGP